MKQVLKKICGGAGVFCGDCEHFKPNKNPNQRFAGGYWIGDGKCLHPQTETKWTVTSNSCEHSAEGEQ